MSTNIFLGYPPENIKNWIIENYKPAEPDMLATPLHFTANEDNSSVSLICFDYLAYEITYDSYCKFEYSMSGKDDDWETYKTGSIIPLNKGETVYFRCPYEKDDPLNQNKNGLCQYEDYGEGYYSINKHYFFKMEGSIKADGNIQFLLDKTGTMAEAPVYCYYRLFGDATGENGNTALTQAPKLPATTLAYYCYSFMFVRCTTLTHAPELLATTLTENCYDSMFYNCSSLNNVNVNFSAWNPSNATSDWLYGVASAGTFTCPTELPDTPRDRSHIPAGWTRADKQ